MTMDATTIGVIVVLLSFLVVGAAGYYWHKPWPEFATKGDELVYRATGLLDFNFPLLTKIVRKEKPALTPEDIDRILRRYHEHVSFWNIGIETVQGELVAFASAAGLQPSIVIQKFNGYDLTCSA
jgi:hypothetical protein